MHRRLFALTFVLAALSPTPAAGTPADIVVTDARIFTGDPDAPWAQALAIEGGTVRAVGSNTEIAAQAGPRTRRIAAGGRLVIPGINDAHVHAPFGSGEEAVRLAIPENADADAVLAVVAEAVKQHPEGTLLIGQLSPASFDLAPTRAALDRVAPKHRVRLAPPGGHAALLNARALADWQIAEDADDPPGGAYGRKDGRLDGWLYEFAYWQPQRRLAEALPDEHWLQQLAAFEDQALRHGITSVQTMPLISAARTERLLARLPARLHWRVIDFRIGAFDGSASSRPVKYVLDGTPIERGAALTAPYADAPQSLGRLNYTQEEIATMVANAATGRSQLLVHVAGDASVRAVLDAMEAHAGVDWPRLRVRLEHGDSIDAALLPRVQALGAIVVQNPAHLTGGIAPARLGEERHAGYQKLASLLEAGIPVALGSDGPLNPYLNMLFAARHHNPREALTVEQSLQAYTSGAAYAEFAEARKGRLTPGMRADLAILSQDITQVPLEALPATQSVLTMVAGRVVHDAVAAVATAPVPEGGPPASR